MQIPTKPLNNLTHIWLLIHSIWKSNCLDFLDNLTSDLNFEVKLSGTYDTFQSQNFKNAKSATPIHW